MRSNSRNCDKQCVYCNKTGHTESKCYKLQNKNKRANENDERGKQKANVTDASVVGDKGDDLLLVLMTERSKFISEWILDSGSSYHMCPNRD